MAVPPPSFLAERPALRRALRGARARFLAGLPDREAAQAALTERLQHLLAEAGPFSGYAAHKGEPDVLPFLFAAFRTGHRIALPHVDAEARMSFVDWHPEAVLGRHANGLPQPPAPGDVEPTVLLVPLVGFDRTGARLGQGGGFYDRWIAAHPTARRIGVAWSVQEVASLPVAPWDMPLDAIVTEQEWIVP